MFDKSQARQEIIEFYSHYKPSRFWNDPKWYGDKKYIYDYVNNYYKDNEELNKLPIARKCYHIIHNLNYIPKTFYKNFYEGYYDINNITSAKKMFKEYNNIIFDNIKKYNLLSKDEIKKIILYCLKNQKYKELLNNSDLNYSINHYVPSNINDWEIKFLYIIHNGDIYCPICGNIKKHDKIATLRKTCDNSICKHAYLSNISKTRNFSHLFDPIIIKKKTESRKGYRHSDETIKKIKESNKKTWTPEKRKKLIEQNKNNGVYIKQSETMKTKILNGEFTPATKNRLTHKTFYSSITKIKYRSSWELKFHESHLNFEYEKMRIPYIFNNEKHVYIIDFIDNKSKKIIEIKPKSLCKQSKNICKFRAAEDWARANGFQFIILTENTLNNYQ